MDTAERLLLAPGRLNLASIERCFGTLMAHRLDYADLYFQYQRAEGWSLEEGIVKSGSFNIEQGVGVRAVSGEKTAFAYSDDISGCRCAPQNSGLRCTRRTIRSVPCRMPRRCACSNASSRSLAASTRA